MSATSLVTCVETTIPSATGSVHVLDLPDPAAARAFAFDEPGYQAGVYRDVLLRRWRNALGRTMWDFPGGRTGGNRYLVLGLGSGAAADVSLPAAPTQRALYETSLLEIPSLVEVVKASAAQGEEIRLVPKLPLKLTIVDSRAVAFNMPDPVEGHDLITTLVVHHPMLAATLKLAFDTMWASGETLDSALAGHHT